MTVHLLLLCVVLSGSKHVCTHATAQQQQMPTIFSACCADIIDDQVKRHLTGAHSCITWQG